jgi:hypothetical protein
MQTRFGQNEYETAKVPPPKKKKTKKPTKHILRHIPLTHRKPIKNKTENIVFKQKIKCSRSSDKGL